LPTSFWLFLIALLAIAVVIAALFLDRLRLLRAHHAAVTASRQAHALFETLAPGWLAGTTTGGGFVASPALADWLGVKESEAPAMLHAAVPEIGRLAAEGKAFERTVEIAGRWLRLVGRLVPDGKAVRPFVLVSDVTAEIGGRQALTRGQQEARILANRMTALFNAAPFPLWLRDETLALVFVNDAYVKAVGAGSRDSVLAGQVELTAGTLATSMRDEAAAATASGQPQRNKHFAVIGDQRRALQIVTAPLSDGGTAGFAVDATESEDLASEISRLTEAHKETLNTLHSAVAIFAPDKTLDYFNHPFAQLWQLSEDWLDTHPHHADLLDAMREQRRLPEQVDFKSWRAERLRQYTDVLEPREEYWHLPDGRTLRVVSHAHPMGGILQLFEDVTDRLAMQRSFNTLIAVQRETLNRLHEGVAVFSSDGLLRLHNPPFASMWRLEAAVLETGPHIGRILDMSRDLFASGDGADEIHGVVLGSHEHRQLHQGRLKRSDGSLIDYTSVPLPDGDTLITFIDVTDRLNAEHALRERNEALEAADRLKSEFVAHVSYELRTPLNTIIGFSEILDAEHFGKLNEKQKEYVADIVRSSETLRALVNDILDLSMIEAGALTLDIEKVAVQPLLAEAATISAEDIAKKGLTCTIDCAPGIGATRCDRRRLLQVLYNLVSNAVKYTPEGGSIVVGARRRNGAIEISVEDTGIGIPEEEQEKVFTKFHSSGPRGDHGAGLGLSLVKSFIEMHQGRVVLASAPGKGTVVTCILPDQAQTAPTEAKKSEPEDSLPSTVH
jgi:signal transduction histidine kinase